ncbi:hypothetical protein WICMUC_002494 [Wickerhamomyces mucosus]|uniref:Reverse transcriptase domain-containing protein n=1 Tax=Wickerhamomyces mucosus TaxID=1378264 RepID=A0A9P8PPD9_9ASCO|nr:hypothetical protein WICMUC_002494 [Wickerhamomyces mucosus]
MLTFVDDFMIASKVPPNQILQELQTVLDIKEVFNHKDISIKYIGYNINRTIDDIGHTKSIRIRERKLKKPFKTPDDANFSVPKNLLENFTPSEYKIMLKELQHLVGTLAYVTYSSRPDMCYSISNIAKYIKFPTDEIFEHVFRNMFYLFNTSERKIIIQNRNESEEEEEEEDDDIIKLDIFTDSSLNNDYIGRSQHSLLIYYHNIRLTCFESKTSKSVHPSSNLSELSAIINGYQKMNQIINILSDITSKRVHVNFYTDSTGSINFLNGSSTATNKSFRKHLYLFKEMFRKSYISMFHIKRNLNISDLLTKHSPPSTYNYIIDALFTNGFCPEFKTEKLMLNQIDEEFDEDTGDELL